MDRDSIRETDMEAGSRAPVRTVDELCDRLWCFTVGERPQLGTYLGVAKAEDRLDYYCEDRYKQKAEFCRSILQESEVLLDADLHPSESMSLKMVRYYADICLKGLEYQTYLMPVNFFEGPDTWFRLDIVQKMSLNSELDYSNYCSRLKAFPAQVDEVREVMGIGLERGIMRYRASMRRVPERLTKLIQCPVEETIFYQPLVKISDSLDEDIKERLRAEAKSVISGRIHQALTDLRDFIDREYLPGVRPQPSICSLPGGMDRYQMDIRFYADTDWTPQKIHDIGKSEVDHLKKRISKVMKKVGYDGTSLTNFVRYLQTKDELYFNNVEEMMEELESVVKKKIKPQLHRLFKTSADTDVEFHDDRTGDAPAMAIYFGPTPGGARPAHVLVNAADPRRLPRYEVMTLMLHEVEPGHHLQTVHMSTLTSLPYFRRFKDDRRYFEAPGRFPLNTAYTEGWGLYAEQLGDEMGLFEDPYDEFGYCCQNISRAARLVGDTGIHALGWSEEDTAAYLAENTPLSGPRITEELARFIGWPGQALAYKIGHLKIMGLRAKTEKSLGSSFDIKDFHEALLDHGQVPLDLLEEVVDSFIDSVKQREKLT